MVIIAQAPFVKLGLTTFFIKEYYDDDHVIGVERYRGYYFTVYSALKSRR